MHNLSKVRNSERTVKFFVLQFTLPGKQQKRLLGQDFLFVNAIKGSVNISINVLGGTNCYSQMTEDESVENFFLKKEKFSVKKECICNSNLLSFVLPVFYLTF